MSKRVIIELQFDYDTVEDSDVYEYLHQLMENKCLDWEFGETTII